MARTGITYDNVQHAADQLVASGDKPTIQAVRSLLGTGSPNTIHRYLQQWRATQAPAERQAVRLPEELASALAKEIERQAAAARAEAEADALEARQAADDLGVLGEELEQQADQLSQELVAVGEARDGLRRERDAALVEVTRLGDDLARERLAGGEARDALAQARNRIETLEEQRDQEHSARLEAQRESKTSEQARIAAERAQAVAMAKLEAAQEQAAERLEALKTEQQARKDDKATHKQALAEQRDEWRERLSASEKQVQDAQQARQEAEKEVTKAKVRVESMAARLEALEASLARQGNGKRREEQPDLPLDAQN